MKKLLDLWKSLFIKYFDINQNGKLDKFEVVTIISFIFIYNIFFQILGNYIYDLIK